MHRATIGQRLPNRGNHKQRYQVQSPKEETCLVQKSMFGSSAPKPFHILELSLQISTTLGLISGSTFVSFWEGIHEIKLLKNLVSLTQTKRYLLFAQ